MSSPGFTVLSITAFPNHTPAFCHHFIPESWRRGLLFTVWLFLKYGVLFQFEVPPEYENYGFFLSTDMLVIFRFYFLTGFYFFCSAMRWGECLIYPVLIYENLFLLFYDNPRPLNNIFVVKYCSLRSKMGDTFPWG